MHELFYLAQFMLPEVAIRIRLFIKNASFCLVSHDLKPDYYVDFENARIRARYVKSIQRITAKLKKGWPAIQRCVQFTVRQKFDLVS